MTRLTRLCLTTHLPMVIFQFPKSDNMVGVAQSVEHMVVAHVVVGSSPIAHPKYMSAHGDNDCGNNGNLCRAVRYVKQKAPGVNSGAFFSSMRLHAADNGGLS